jgi:hypothetical protein
VGHIICDTEAFDEIIDGAMMLDLFIVAWLKRAEGLVGDCLDGRNQELIRDVGLFAYQFYPPVEMRSPNAERRASSKINFESGNVATTLRSPARARPGRRPETPDANPSDHPAHGPRR